MKKYITIAALLVAGTAFANAADTTVTFEPQNDAPSGGSVWLNWNLQSQDGYYVKPVYETDLFTFSWGALVSDDSEGRIMNQNQLPLNKGCIIPYNTTKYNLSFNVTAKEDIEISTVSFLFVGAMNGGSFDNAAGVTKNLTISLGDEKITKDIKGTSVVDLASPPSGNLVSFAKTIKINEGDSHTFTLGVSGQEDLRTGLKSISISAAPVPEPSAFGLLAGIGALALVASRRRRK